jgi:hypothetical protein
LPNATITATNIETGQTHTVATNASGGYVIPDLPIGHYNLKGEAAGFKTMEQNGIALNVGDRVRLDFRMQLGPVKEAITVKADAAKIETESGEVSSVVTGPQVTQLATNGRSIYTLANLTPGSSNDQADFNPPTAVGGDNNVSFNGLRVAHNLYMLDGSETYDRGGGGGTDIMPSLDAIAEFRMLTSNYSAEYGLSSAATMSAVLRSGTKRFHATAWEFLRNDALDARNYFNRAPNPVAELRFNTFGFNFGGPVPFKDKGNPRTFFFYNMEWRRFVQGQTLNMTVPPAGEYPDAGGTGTGAVFPVPLQVPTGVAGLGANCPGGVPPVGVAAGQLFPNNTIPSCMIDANAEALLAAGIFPQPTDGNQFIGGNNVPTNVREEIVRIDHQFSDKLRVFGHYVQEDVRQSYGATLWTGSVPTVGDTLTSPSYSAVVHTMHIVSPDLVNEVAFHYNGNRNGIVPRGIINSNYSFNRVFPGPNAMNRNPSIYLFGSTGSIYDVGMGPWNNSAGDYQVRDDVSWVKGRHQLRFGASWAFYKKIQELYGETQGQFMFFDAYTGNDFGDFLLGYAGAYSELAVQDRGFWNNVSWAAYGQDNWRVNARLTLNLGFRWDGVPHTYEGNNRVGNFYRDLYDPSKIAIFAAGSNGSAIDPSSPGLGPSPNPDLQGAQFYLNGIGIPGQHGIPKGLVDNHWWTPGPRVGFAYDLTGRRRTVIRGGFAALYERIQGNDMYHAGPNIPFSSSVTFNGVSLSNPNTSLASGHTVVASIAVANIVGLDRANYKLPVSYQYSAGVQQALGAGTVLSIAYVGNQNRHQNDYREINLPDPSLLPSITAGTASPYNTLLPYAGFQSIRLAANEANSHYNSLQLELHGQPVHGLQLQVSYTLSRAVDPTTGSGAGSDLQGVSNPYVGWRHDLGPSILDRTHVAFVNFVYNVPLLRNSPRKALKSTLGGWQVSGIVAMQSGVPLSIWEGGLFYNGAQGNICNTLPCFNRPNFSGRRLYPQTTDHWFSTSGFTATAPGEFGNLGYNTFRGPGRDNWNLVLFKNFNFSDRGTRLEFRAECFNTWNHTQFHNVSTFASFGDAGVINNNFGAVTSAYDPRTFQLALKFYY